MSKPEQILVIDPATELKFVGMYFSRSSVANVVSGTRNFYRANHFLAVGRKNVDETGQVRRYSSFLCELFVFLFIYPYASH